MYCTVIEFGTPEYDEAIRLRYDILRKPLQMEFDPIDIAKEYNEYHIGCYDPLSEALIGVLSLKPLSNGTIKMRQVAVAADVQSKGIGSFLVSFSESFVTSKSYSRIELHARIDAVPFYLKNGYSQSGDIFQEVGIDHLFMYKDV